MGKFILAIVLMVFTTSCLLRSHYYRPEVAIPQDWRIQADESSSIANLRWWEEWKDPVLNDLIETALENNKDLGVAVGRVHEYAALLGIAKSYQFPEINGTGVASRQDISLNLPQVFPQNFGIYNLFTTLLNLTYYVDIWGKIQNQVDASFAELVANVEARRSLVLTIVSQVAATYVLLRQYDEQLEISKQTYFSRSGSYELFKLRYEGGLNSELEVKQAEAEALEALVEVKRLEILIPQTENLISVLIGINPGPIERGRLLDNFELPPCIPAGLPSDLLEQRPDLLQAENQLIATNSKVAEAKADFFPQINLTGFYGNQSFELKNLFTGNSTTWQVGASVFQQIFNAGRISYQLEVQEAKRMQALYNYYSLIQKAFKEVNDALVAHEISIQLLEILKREVDALQIYLDLANLQYENGQTDYLNVLDAERKLFNAQLERVQFQGDVFNSLVAIYAALGGGWVIEADNQVKRKMPNLHELRCYDVE